MSRPRLAVALAALAAAVAVVVVALVVGLAGRHSTEDAEALPIEGPRAAARWIEVQGALAPRVALFADTLTLRVDVTILRSRIDAASLRLAENWEPWDVVGRPERSVREDGTARHLRVVYRLRCLAASCVPPSSGPLTTRFEPVVVSYRRLADPVSMERRQLRARWPKVVLHTRLDQAELFRRGVTPWRADLLTLPEVSYRVQPAAVAAALSGAGAIFALVGIGLLVAARPRRAPVVAAEVVSEPAPPPPTPVELALAVLEHPAGTDGAADRRRALQLVSAELRTREAGVLAGEAHTLAWSKRSPGADPARALATRARPTLVPEPEPEEAGEEGEPDA